MIGTTLQKLCAPKNGTENGEGGEAGDAGGGGDGGDGEDGEDGGDDDDDSDVPQFVHHLEEEEKIAPSLLPH